MYVSGHILTSVLVARGMENRFRVGLGTLAAYIIGASLIDADHLFFYCLDDGTASSFALHPLHRYWYLTLLTIALIALILRRLRPYLVAIFVGVALHYSMDLLANSVHYNIYFLLISDLICYIAALIVIKYTSKAMFFLTAALLIPTLINAFLLYILKIGVSASPIYHIMTIIELTIAAFWARRVLR